MNKTTEALKLAGLVEASIEECIGDDGMVAVIPLDLYNDLMTAIREALAEPEITTPDVCGEVCARAKLCYGCNKAFDEALAEPVKQEPEYWEVRNGVCKHGVYRTKEQAEEVRFDMQKSHDLSGSLASFNVRPLYAAPVDAKAIRAEALEEAAKFAYKMRFRSCWTAEAIADGIRGLK